MTLTSRLLSLNLQSPEHSVFNMAKTELGRRRSVLGSQRSLASQRSTKLLPKRLLKRPLRAELARMLFVVAVGAEDDSDELWLPADLHFALHEASSHVNSS